MKAIVSLALTILFLLTVAVSAQIGGTVDWVNRTVKAKGIGAPNPNMPEAAARPAAIRAAKQIALRDALELIKGISLNSQTTIKDAMVANDQVSTSVNGFMQGFQFEANPHYMSDGTVEIEVTVPMDGSNGFGQAIFGGSANMIPDKGAPSVSPAAPRPGAYTGLVIDAKGMELKPALMPRVLNEADKEIYGSAFVTREFAVKYGMCGYSKSVSGAQKLADRVGDNPLVIKAVKASGANKADVVVSNRDADAIQGAAKSMSFLNECRVILVID
ncbi:MAG: hypothetical protein V1913_03635 [Fibrobacterota bacterium]